MSTPAVNPAAGEKIVGQQESEYWFPYHYVARFGAEGFRPSFTDTWAACYVSTMEFLLERIAADQPATVVDVGCGDGRFSRELAVANPLRQVSGVDFSQRAIAMATAMNAEVTNLDFICTDITSAALPRTFDAAVLMEVLEHIEPAQADDFLAAIARMLKPGGTLYLTVPHANKPVEPKHFRHFSCDSLRASLQGHFEIEEMLPFERRSWMRWLSDRLLSNRFVTLSHAGLLNAYYRWYRKALFVCDTESQCQRIYVKARVR